MVLRTGTCYITHGLWYHSHLNVISEVYCRYKVERYWYMFFLILCQSKTSFGSGRDVGAILTLLTNSNKSKVEKQNRRKFGKVGNRGEKLHIRLMFHTSFSQNPPSCFAGCAGTFRYHFSDISASKLQVQNIKWHVRLKKQETNEQTKQKTTTTRFTDA